MNQRVQLLHIIHHRRSRQTESVDRFEMNTCACRDSDPVLHTLSFVENHSIKLAYRSKKREELSHRGLIVIFHSVLFHLLMKFLKALELCRKSSVGCQNNVVSSEIVPTQLSALSVNHVSAQTVPNFDLCSDLLLPLADERDRTNDQCSLLQS